MHLYHLKWTPWKSEHGILPFCLSFSQSQQTSPFLVLSVLATCLCSLTSQWKRERQISEQTPAISSSELEKHSASFCRCLLAVVCIYLYCCSVPSQWQINSFFLEDLTEFPMQLFQTMMWLIFFPLSFFLFFFNLSCSFIFLSQKFHFFFHLSARYWALISDEVQDHTMALCTPLILWGRQSLGVLPLWQLGDLGHQISQVRPTCSFPEPCVHSALGARHPDVSSL